ncbi:MAG TPA: hypothetical protein DEP57_08670 [Selenomonas sp.]|nr:hypothetical protein [Selenomonas sp.]
MKIEEIREALKNKAQSLNITPVTLATPVQEQAAPATTPKPRQKSQPVSETPAVVVPLNAQHDPAPVPTPVAVEQKPTRKAPARNPRAKTKGADSLSDIEAVVAEHLRAGVDYNTIPGCGRKPALLKSGAEVLCSVFGFRTTSEVINRVMELEKGFALYEVKTTVFDADRNIRAVGLGSCNSHEKKYIKQGLAMSANTILKMARKRSYVDAILSATAASRVFTQDIEELSSIGMDHQKESDNQ